jgi:hypothetical protein
VYLLLKLKMFILDSDNNAEVFSRCCSCFEKCFNRLLPLVIGRHSRGTIVLKYNMQEVGALFRTYLEFVRGILIGISRKINEMRTSSRC